jgi:hypothetical protein
MMGTTCGAAAVLSSAVARGRSSGGSSSSSSGVARRGRAAACRRAGAARRMPFSSPLTDLSREDATFLAAGVAASLALPVALTVAALRCSSWRAARRRRARAAAVASGALGAAGEEENDVLPAWLASRFVPFTSANAADCVALDCTHPTVPNLTHHRGSSTPAALKADTSGGIALNAARARHDWLQRPHVTCNHFDMDGLVAVYTALQPAQALEHEALLRECAHVGDFRELDVSSPHGGAALALNVWVNSVERTRFYRPFRGSEAQGAARKYAHFLPRLPAALAYAEVAGEFAATLLPPNAVLREAGGAWEEEHTRVLDDVAALADAGPAALRKLPALGLVVVDAPRPLHYYALFGATRGFDSVLTMYPGNKYELEHKYTGFVCLASRASMPRLDLAPLAAALTAAEVAAGATAGEFGWVANSVVDSGPMLRLERLAEGKASKADRYAHPYEREILSSRIAPDEFEKAVRGYFGHGLRGVKPRADWAWADIHDVNGAVDWSVWRAACKLPGVAAAA